MSEAPPIRPDGVVTSAEPVDPETAEPITPDDVDAAPMYAVLAAAERSSRRRWPLVVFGAAVGVAGTLAGSAYLSDRDGDSAVPTDELDLATAPVEQQDLREEIEWAGVLGHGDPVAVRGPSGVVTGAASAGTTLERGDAIAWVDDAPVVVLYGATPMWRSLSEGSEGVDVRQLEANLATLGYDPDATVDIDEVFTAATEAMVERWQEDIGREPTGAVDGTDVIVVEGPAAVVSVAEIGSPTSGQLATLAPGRAVDDVVATVDGTVTELAPVGTVIESGQTLYRIDDVPVVAITAFDAVAAALLDETFTDLELEQALAAEGHDPDEAMTVDGVITDATSVAIQRWQQAAGLPVTGLTDPGYYLDTATGHLIDGHRVEAGAELITGGPVLTTSRSRLSVTVTVQVAEVDEFEVGQAVAIELADESTVDGTVAEIGPVVPAANAQDEPTVEIVVGVIAGSDDDLVDGPVTVISIGEEIVGATVIPNRALVALAEGGFAVERVVGDGGTELIGVELGAFADGVVEVVDGDLKAGDLVVVPR